MGVAGEENVTFAPEYRLTVGVRWGYQWGSVGTPSGHGFYDIGEAAWLDRRDAATPSQTLSGWIATMGQAEAAWFTAQPTARQSAWLTMAKLAQARNAY